MTDEPIQLLGDFPPLLALLSEVKPGDINPLTGTGGHPTAAGTRTVFGEMQVLHEAFVDLQQRVAAMEAPRG